MENFCLSKNEKLLLKSLLGKKIIKIRHDSFDKFEREAVYGRIELFFEDCILLINYDYAPYYIFGAEDDRPKFSVRFIDEVEAVSALQDTIQIDVGVSQTLHEITLVEDYSDVDWCGKKDSLLNLKAIILKLDDKEIVIQGDYMIPLLEIFQGDNVLKQLDKPGEEFDGDKETKFETKRHLIHLSTL